MGLDICPPWLGVVLASPVRKIWQDPGRILKPYVSEGMTVLEPGPGMGFFTIEMARRVGPGGKVVAVDLQEKMLEGVRKRAIQAGVADRVDRRVVTDDLGLADLAGKVDFVLLFYMLHEVKDRAGFLGQVAAAMKPGARVLLAEPRGHVSPRAFDAELDAALAVGLPMVKQPGGIRSRWAVLEKARQ